MSAYPNGNGRDVYGELDELRVKHLHLFRDITNLDAHTREGLRHLDDTLKEFRSELVSVGEASHETRERVKQLEGAVLQIAQALEALSKDAERKHAAMMRALKRNNSKPSNSSVRPVARKGK